MISGIGSMLIGAKQQGYDIVGNIEWRPYYWTGTFEHNFPGAFMAKTVKDLTPEQYEACMNPDLLIGHTECGNFSRLNSDQREKGKFSDIPQFVEAIQLFKPKVFAMDNLAPMLGEFTPGWWADMLPGYDIFFQWVGNGSYGNPQVHRKRLFVIGAERSLGFYFIPGEKDIKFTDTVRQRLSGLPEDAPNHQKLADTDIVAHLRLHQFVLGTTKENNRNITLAEFREFIKNWPAHKCFECYGLGGTNTYTKLGFCKINQDRHANVLHKTSSFFKEEDAQPLTVRERARIQGCPDDFEFIPLNAKPNSGPWQKQIVQTGKFMPVEFCTYLTGYVKWFLEGNNPEAYPGATGQRHTIPNPIVSQAQQDFCRKHAYRAQAKVCHYCSQKMTCPVKENPAQLSLFQ